MQALSRLLALSILAIPASTAWAHGGGLDKQGCHTNRKSGDYHCHRGADTSPPAPARLAPGNNLTPARDSPPQQPNGSKVFANCAEARAAGATPVHRGERGYGAHLDRDNDGIGCEPYRGR